LQIRKLNPGTEIAFYVPNKPLARPAAAAQFS